MSQASLSSRLILLFLVEVVYWVGSRRLAFEFRDSRINSELARTALRLVTFAADFALARSIILSRAPNLSALRQPSLYAGVLLFLLVPVLVGGSVLSAPEAWLFAVTSVAVGFKEEFLFRGVIQNLLGRRMDAVAAVLVTSALFTVWHIGLVRPTFWMLAQIFLASVLLGLVYIRSGSIAAVVVLHATYDAMFSLPRFISPPLGTNWGLLMLLASVAAATVWAWKTSNATRGLVRT